MIAIVDYDSGNIASLQNAIDKLGYSSKVVQTPEELDDADKIVFPGQGRAGTAMERLKKRNLISVLQDTKVPFLGICLGMQLLSRETEEDHVKGLNIIPVNTRRLKTTMSIPHMGWNKVCLVKECKLTQGVSSTPCFYFANSYYVDLDWRYTIGYVVYSMAFSAIQHMENFYAVQFHPEKSGKDGLQVLKNFCSL